MANQTFINEYSKSLKNDILEVSSEHDKVVLKKYNKELFSLDFSSLDDICKILGVENSSFLSVIFGQWGDCNLPDSKDLNDISEMLEFVDKSFSQIEKYGGVQFFIIPKDKSDFFLTVNYSGDIGLCYLNNQSNTTFINDLKFKLPKLFAI